MNACTRAARGIDFAKAAAFLRRGAPPTFTSMSFVAPSPSAATSRASSWHSENRAARNFRGHQILVDGYRGITYVDSDGVEQNPTIRFIGSLLDR